MTLESETRFSSNGSKSFDVASIGDPIVDKVILLELVDEDSGWVPEQGESIMVDEVPAYLEDVAVETVPGGRGPNQAVAASLSGAETCFLGQACEEYDLSYLEDGGVDLSAMEPREGDLSTSYVFQDQGDNRISFVRGSEPVMTEEYLEDALSVLQDAEYLLMSNGEPDYVKETVLEGLGGEGTEVVFDPAPAEGAEEWLDYDAVSYVTPNEVEYKALNLEDVDAEVVRTSADGAYTDEFSVLSPSVEVVHTTGAGDTFNGYLAGCLSQGMDLHSSVSYAVAAASLSVTGEGVQSSMPEWREVEELLSIQN